jgi:iron complex transport system substrate-binding protein
VASDPAGETNVLGLITTGADWAGIKAVQDKRVYQIPHGPFDWFDRPPSVGRLLGVEWLGNLLYPDLYATDIKSTVKDFYKLFYHFELSDAQLSTLMAHALP